MDLEDIAKLCGESGTIGSMTWMGIRSMIHEKNNMFIKTDMNRWVKLKKEMHQAQIVYDQARLDKREKAA